MEYSQDYQRRPEAPVEDGHGRSAVRPSDTPRGGWWDILKRVGGGISEKNLSLAASGAAFYGFLAIPSALTALVAFYGFMLDPADVGTQVAAMRGVLPGEAIGLISTQLKSLTSHSAQTLSISFVISILVALWGAMLATTSIMSALNMAYGLEEKRSLFKYYLTALVLTAATIVSVLTALALIAVLPVMIGMLPFGGFGQWVVTVARWPILVGLVLIMLAVLYRYAPSHNEPKWRWVSWGVFAATVLWIAGSALFSLYVEAFATYNKTYGSLGAVVVLMVWLYYSSFAVLLGAELNAEIEHQTAREGTTGPEEPMAGRGASVADILGRE